MLILRSIAEIARASRKTEEEFDAFITAHFERSVRFYFGGGEKYPGLARGIRASCASNAKLSAAKQDKRT